MPAPCRACRDTFLPKQNACGMDMGDPSLTLFRRSCPSTGESVRNGLETGVGHWRPFHSRSGTGKPALN